MTQCASDRSVPGWAIGLEVGLGLVVIAATVIVTAGGAAAIAAGAAGSVGAGEAALLGAGGSATVLAAEQTAEQASAEIPAAASGMGLAESEAAAAVEPPAGAGPDWTSRVADNDKGRVWQVPGETGGASSVWIMEPTLQYPNGYVRFHNEYGQPFGLDGKPGANSATHISLNPDGTYPVPKGW